MPKSVVSAKCDVARVAQGGSRWLRAAQGSSKQLKAAQGGSMQLNTAPKLYNTSFSDISYEMSEKHALHNFWVIPNIIQGVWETYEMSEQDALHKFVARAAQGGSRQFKAAQGSSRRLNAA